MQVNMPDKVTRSRKWVCVQPVIDAEGKVSYPKPKPFTCPNPDCGDTVRYYDNQIAGPYYTRPDCTCEQERMKDTQRHKRAVEVEDRRMAISLGLEELNLPEQLAYFTWETLTTDDGNKGAMAIGATWLRTFPNLTLPGLFLYGPPGTGKTTITACLARKAITDGKLICGATRRTARFVNVPLWIAEIHAAYGSGGDVAGIMRRAKDAYLLVLDDIGAEKVTEAKRELLYQLIVHRDQHKLPTLVTSNLTSIEIDKQVDPRIGSRLCSMCGFVELTGRDRRKVA